MAGNKDRYRRVMSQGHSAAWDQTWDQAAAHYRQALEEFPDDQKAITSLALALFEIKDYPEAIIYYRRAAEATPQDPLPRLKIADLLERLNQPAEAFNEYVAIADLYVNKKDFNKAIEAWSKASRIDPESIAIHSRLAVAYERVGKKQLAVLEYLAIGGLLQHKGEVQKASQAVSHAAQLLPESSEVRQALATIKMGKPLPKPSRPQPVKTAKSEPVRQIGAAKAAEESALQGLDPIQETRQKAISALAGLLFDLSEDNLDQAVRREFGTMLRGEGQGGAQQSDQTRTILHLSQAVDLQSQGHNEMAIEELQWAIEGGLEHGAAFFNLGYLLSQTDRQVSAIKNLQRSTNYPEFTLGANLVLGEIYLRLGQIKESALAYLEALRSADTQVVNPEQAEALSQTYDPIIEANAQSINMQALNRLCENIASFLMQPDWRVNVARARQQLPSQPGSGALLPIADVITETRGSQIVESMTEIQQRSQQGKLRSAMEEAYYAIQYAPSYLPLHISLGELLMQQNRTEDAVEKFSVVARSYTIRGEVERAVGLYRRIIEMVPMDMEKRSRLIELLVLRGEVDSAIQEYLQLAEVYYSQADLVMARNSYNQALQLSQQASASRSWKLKVLRKLADFDMQSLDWREALRVFEQIRTADPDDEKTRANLIALNLRLGQETAALDELDHFLAYLLQNQQMGRGIKFLEGMVAETPDQPSLRRRLAELFRQSGNPKQAIAQLDKAGELLLEAGDREGAIQAVLAILALNPPNAEDYHSFLNQLKSMGQQPKHRPW